MEVCACACETTTGFWVGWKDGGIYSGFGTVAVVHFAEKKKKKKGKRVK